MFKRQRRHSKLRIFGLILAAIGGIMFLYIIPMEIWLLIVAILFIMLGLIIAKIF